jgi:predicted DNA-binding transcriptional regulator YafY
MPVRDTIVRYHLIISKLRKHPVTFNELADFLERESEFHGFTLTKAKRTIQRDFDAIRSIYNIDIHFDFRRGVYVLDPDDNHEKNLRMLEALDLFNAMKVTENISGIIHFEKRRPQGTENLNGLLHAIQHRTQVEFTYSKYWEEHSTQRITEPYALKEFKNRWYLLAVDHKDQNMKTFALDRLTNIDITKRKFQYPRKFDVYSYFEHCFGIITPNDDEAPQDVILSFDPYQGKYIKSLPLHESQEVLIDNEHEVRIKLKIYPTHDFLMEILSHGENVKVIQPAGLIESVRNSYQKALNQY